eukprot:486437-Alexandrium_andersonii.AAC.1
MRATGLRSSALVSSPLPLGLLVPVNAGPSADLRLPALTAGPLNARPLRARLSMGGGHAPMQPTA